MVVTWWIVAFCRVSVAVYFNAMLSGWYAESLFILGLLVRPLPNMDVIMTQLAVDLIKYAQPIQRNQQIHFYMKIFLAWGKS